MSWLRMVLVLVLLAGSLCFLSCSQEEMEQEEVIRPVRYAQVYVTGGSRVRTFSGTTQAGIESNLSFRVAGTVQSVNVQVGDAVRRGQLLAKLDDSDYCLQVQEAEASFEQAQAQERSARATYERVQGLYVNRNASRQDLDNARAAFESASAMVQAIQQRLEMARLQVNYTSLNAPQDGNISIVHAERNENIAAGTPIVTLTAGQRPEVRVSVPERLISQIRNGSRATVTFGAIPGQEFSATVTEVGVSATSFATAFPVIVQLNRDVADLRPGMAAEVSFRFETAGTEERLIVPPVAVGEDRNGRFVFVLEPSEEGISITRRREVRVGEITAEGMEILGGLEEGELVVTAGVSRIVDGQRVRLQ